MLFGNQIWEEIVGELDVVMRERGYVFLEDPSRNHK